MGDRVRMRRNGRDEEEKMERDTTVTYIEPETVPILTGKEAKPLK